MLSLEQLRQPVADELVRYRTLFDETLCHDDDSLGKALAHIRSRKGKMMRPLLVLLIARQCGGVGESTLRAAVTLELLHTASLVHDDVVDESDERRGQASVNVAYGNQVAVLLGDYILSVSLEQAARTGKLECVEIIARLGATLSEGEILQLSNIRNEQADEDAYFRVIHRKTAALFAACGQLAALTAGADADFVENARMLGEYIGICFQIRDDIFDYYSDAAIGKPTGNDMREGKLTLPVLYALRNTDDADIHAIARRVKGGTATDEDIRRLIQFAKDNGGIEYAQNQMDHYRELAEQCLARFTDDVIRSSLQGFIDYVVGRNY